MENKIESEIREYTKDWYTMGRTFLPEFDTPRFSKLAGSSTAFAYNLNPEDNGTITIRLSDTCDTAYVDLETNTIFISENYFSKGLYNDLFDAPEKIEELAITLINGSTVHESLHIAHTTHTTIPRILQTDIRFDEYHKTYGLKLMSTVFNIVEDLYIDSQVPENLFQWLQNRAEILFSESALNSLEVDLDNLNYILNLMIFFKNKKIRFNAQFKNLGTEILNTIRNLTEGSFISQGNRVNKVYFLLDLLPKFATDEDGESTIGDGEIPDDLEKVLASLESLTDGEWEIISSEIEAESLEVAKANKNTESDGSLTWNRLEEKDVLKLNTIYRLIEPTSEINFNFLKELQAIRTLNRTPGEARNRGSVLVKSRLTRIATDGKIFAKTDSERKILQRIEVIINVDFSASTSGDVINNELGAAKEMSKVLKAARIPHSVYAHTSRRSSIPLLIHIFSFDMTVTNFDWTRRFDAAEGISLSENYDGVVITRLQTKFTKRQATRYIINLSDGYPQGPGYTGRKAAAHTAKVIKETRQMGIGVFAISVVDHVVKANDIIYGRTNNIDGSKNVSNQFRNLIRKLMV